MRLILDSRTPVYIQVIEYYKVQIASGELEKGAEIPSRRELANTLKINPNTVQRAYKEMEAEGMIFTDGNMPSKVTEDDNVIKEIRSVLLHDTITDFITSVKDLNVPLDEVLPLIEAKYKDEEKSNKEEEND